MKFFSQIFRLFSTKKSLFGVYVGLLFLVPIIFLNLPLQAKKYGDNTFFVEAKVLSSVCKGQLSIGEIEFEKAPGPSIFYAIPFLFLSSDNSDLAFWKLGAVWNFLVVISGLLILNIRILNRYGKIPSSLFFLFSMIIPLQFYYSTGIIAEPPAFFIGSLLVFVILNFPENENFRVWLKIFILLFFLFLVRPNTGLIFGFLFVLGLVGYLRRKDSSLFISREWKALVFGSLSVIAMVLATNVMVGKINGPDSKGSQQDYLFYIAHAGRFQFRSEPFNWAFWDDNNRPNSKDYNDWLESNRRFNGAYKNKEERKKAVRAWILEDAVFHPIITLKQLAIRAIFGNSLMVNSLSFKGKYLLGVPLVWIYYLGISLINLMNYLLLFLALRYAIQNINSPVLVMVLLFGALIVFHGLIYMEQRYMFPVRPFILFASAIFAANALKR